MSSHFIVANIFNAPANITIAIAAPVNLATRFPKSNFGKAFIANTISHNTADMPRTATIICFQSIVLNIFNATEIINKAVPIFLIDLVALYTSFSLIKPNTATTPTNSHNTADKPATDTNIWNQLIVLAIFKATLNITNDVDKLLIILTNAYILTASSILVLNLPNNAKAPINSPIPIAVAVKAPPNLTGSINDNTNKAPANTSIALAISIIALALIEYCKADNVSLT